MRDADPEVHGPPTEQLVVDESGGTAPAEDDLDRLFAMEVGALRFQDDLAPEEIQETLGVDAEYYRESMRWLLGEVDRTLPGSYPAHVDRTRLAAYATGLADAEARFLVERHVRDCGGCATYLADLLDETVKTVAPDQWEPGQSRALPTINYTNANAWMRDADARQRRGQTPALRLKAAELRAYNHPPRSAAVDVAPEVEDAVWRRRPRPRRRVSSRVLGLGAVAVVLVALAVAALTNGAGKDTADGTRKVADTRLASAPGEAQKRQAERRHAVELRRQQLARRERIAEHRRAAKRRHRARLAARRKQARMRAARARQAQEAQQPQQAQPALPPSSSSTPAPTSPPPPTSAPPVTAQAPPVQGAAPPSSEFGLEP